MTEHNSSDEARSGLVIAETYRLEEQLGRGGMGSVWRCQHLNLDSKVAIKILHPEGFKRKNTRARFLREAKAAAMLRSAHVVQIMDQGTDGPFAYIVMELLKGESLYRRLKRGPLPPAEATIVLSHVARAIYKAHEHGIVHRDLKPDNIFMLSDEDEVLAKVLDFGIAKATIAELNQTGSPQTQTGALLGTPYYMSPEQATGQKDRVDHRSDLWALGVIAYESLLGMRPYQSDNLGELVLQICTRPQPVPSHTANVPPGFDSWFATANARDADRRFQDAKSMIRALADIFAGKTPAAASQRSAPEPADSEGPVVFAPSPASKPSPTTASSHDASLENTEIATPPSFANSPEPQTPVLSSPEGPPAQLSRAKVAVVLGLLAAVGLGIGTRMSASDAPSPVPRPEPSVPLKSPPPGASENTAPAVAAPPTPKPSASAAATNSAAPAKPTQAIRRPTKHSHKSSAKTAPKPKASPKPVPVPPSPQPDQDSDPLGIN